MSEHEDSLLENLREAVRAGRAPSPAVRTRLAGVTDPVLMRKAGRALASLRDADQELRPARVAVLATATIGPFEPLLRASMVSAGLLPTIVAGAYGSFELSLGSAAFAAQADPELVVCLLDDSYFLPADWPATVAAADAVLARLADLTALVTSALAHTSATVLLHTVPLPAARRNAVVSLRARAALAQTWHQLNAGLLELAARHRQVMVADLVSVLADAPYRARDDRLHSYADLPYSDGALLAYAHDVRRVLTARLGLSRKAVAVDLDNTLWGGVIGEVGVAGVQLGGLYPGKCYLAVQRAIRDLRDQGVVLVLLSKNDPELVDEGLATHPQMLLRADAFAARGVNWSAKVDNLRQAAQSLSLTTGSFVFMDDSDFERGAMAAALPEVAIVDASGDPAHLTDNLLRPGHFDVLDLTETDRSRPELYRTRALRSEFSAGFTSSDDYLHALGIVVRATQVTAFEVPRVAQLSARTNQFNQTAVVFSEAATARMSADGNHLVAAFSVSDRFGDEGIVGAAWLATDGANWRVLNLLLSCRVLGRGVELAMVDWLAQRASKAGATTLTGAYLPTKKNGVAEGLWGRAGFQPGDVAGTFVLELAGAPTICPKWITIEETESST